MKLPKCQDCGACCACDWDSKWVEVTERDAKRITSSLLQLGDIEEYAMRQTLGNSRCAALVGEIGKATHCSIYSVRPAICRQVTRGGPICLYMLGYHRVNIKF